MAKQYPLIRDVYRNKRKNSGRVCPCGEQALYKTSVQYNYMRGDDGVIWVCKEHSRDVEFCVNAIRNYYESKEVKGAT